MPVVVKAPFYTLVEQVLIVLVLICVHKQKEKQQQINRCSYVYNFARSTPSSNRDIAAGNCANDRMESLIAFTPYCIQCSTVDQLNLIICSYSTCVVNNY